MLEREEITDDWKTWPAQRLAWALEDHLLCIGDRKDDPLPYMPPDWVLALLDENESSEQPIPMGVGHHTLTGYFVICSAGQGPVICRIENLEQPDPGLQSDKTVPF